MPVLVFMFCLTFLIGCGEEKPQETLSFEVLEVSKTVSVSEKTFLRRFAKLLAQRRYFSAQNYVALWPEIAVGLMYSKDQSFLKQESVAELARQLDEQFGLQRENRWTFRLEQLLSGELKEQEDRHFEISRLVKERNFEKAFARIKQYEKSDQLDVILIDTASTLYRQLGQPSEALKWLNLQLENQTWDPVTEWRIESECLKSAKLSPQANVWEKAWLKAVHQAHRQLSTPVPTRVPQVWKLLVDERPETLDWPLEVQMHLCEDSRLPIDDFTEVNGDVIVLTVIGIWQLKRKQAAQALVTLKQAEALSDPQSNANDWVKYYQAKALTSMNQLAPASAILGALASRKGLVKSPALALLGVIKLDQGHLYPGYSFLKKAVEDSSSTEWLGYYQSVGDLALACFLVDQDELGKKWLKISQEGFANQGEMVELMLSLKNEAHWLTEKGYTKEAHQKRIRVAQIESGQYGDTGH